jgi:2-phospho-L-lactate guanylyltransferase
MNAALLPIRSIAGAKNRLARNLDGGQRERLTLAMLADMVAALRRARALDRVFVVSADAILLAHARKLGAGVLDESALAPVGVAPTNGADAVSGLNRAVAGAARALADIGVERLLAIPGDVPLVGGDEVDALFATDRRCHPVVLVASGSLTGTNGLLLSPPTVLAPCFEGASLEAHRRSARAAGIEPLTVALGGFALDVDTIDDLVALAAHAATHASGQVAAEVLAERGRGDELPAAAAVS